MKIIAKIDCIINDEYYEKGSEIPVSKFEDALKLNEQGFIEPLTYKDLVLIERELQNSKENKMKEERL